MSLLRQKKEEEVEKLAEKFTKSKAAVFVSYKGLKVVEAEKLRRALRTEKGEYRVAKKTLLDVAVKKAGLPESGIANLDGQIGIAFDYEGETGALKVVDSTIKGGIKALSIVGGIVEGKVFDMAAMKQLAALPGKQELRAQVVGVIAAPLRGILSVLNGNTIGLINVLKNASEKKV